MTDEANNQNGIWEEGWAGHERAQLLRMSRLSFAQKLEWLEQADRLVRFIQQNKAQRCAMPTTPELETPSGGPPAAKR